MNEHWQKLAQEAAKDCSDCVETYNNEYEGFDKDEAAKIIHAAIAKSHEWHWNPEKQDWEKGEPAAQPQRSGEHPAEVAGIKVRWHGAATSEPVIEWTPEWIDELLDLKFERGPVSISVSEYMGKLNRVCDAHNAALAEAKGALHHMEACRALLKVPNDEVLYVAIEELQQQLAAEREKREQAEQHSRVLASQIENEVERRSTEKRKPLVEALRRMPEVAYQTIIEHAGVELENLPNELQCICDAVLASVKEGK
jgi:hypothetical protein